jgi:hypothetical protein
MAESSLASASRSLKDNHAATDNSWQHAIDTTLSFANETV